MARNLAGAGATATATSQTRLLVHGRSFRDVNPSYRGRAEVLRSQPRILGPGFEKENLNESKAFKVSFLMHKIDVRTI